MQYRKGEAEQVRFRAKRIFNVEGKFYFHTREGAVVGPYQTEASALSAVSFYIQSISDIADTKRKDTVVNTEIWEKTSFR